MDAALANLGTAIEESGAVIVRAGGQLPTVFGDPTLLVMLWQNLIGNAVKFRRQGVPPRVVIECARGPLITMYSGNSPCRTTASAFQQSSPTRCS